jgi:hypothetical protein
MTDEDMRQYVANEYAVAWLTGVAHPHINSITGEVVKLKRDRILVCLLPR